MVMQMPHWKYKLNFTLLIESYKEGNITLKRLAEEIADRLEGAHFYTEYERDLEGIVDELRGFEEDDTKSYFDDVLDALYDWANGEEPDVVKASGPAKSKTCWIEV